MLLEIFQLLFSHAWSKSPNQVATQAQSNAEETGVSADCTGSLWQTTPQSQSWQTACYCDSSTVECQVNDCSLCASH